MKCPCGTDKDFEQCCGPYHSGESKPSTPEELMRARYSAFALQNIDYIVNTTHPGARDDIDLDDLRAWAKDADWQGFEVIKADADEKSGTVDFVARYKDGEQDVEHHELAQFVCDDGAWYYVDGQGLPSATKVGRNDPCPCGSGKKHKFCCGRRW